MPSIVPAGMSRRHFLRHLAGASTLAVPAITLSDTLSAHADELRGNHKSAILLWMGGGPSTIDLWDLDRSDPAAQILQRVNLSQQPE